MVRRTTRHTLSFLALFTCLTIPARGGSARPDVGSELSLHYNFEGDAGFQIGQNGRLISELVYPLDGWLISADLHAGGHVTDGPLAFDVGARGRLTKSITIDNKGTDTDWDAQGQQLHYSESDCDVDTLSLEGDLYLAFAITPPDRRITTGLTILPIGVAYHRFDMTCNGLDGLYYYGTQPVSRSGLVSTYDLEFIGPRSGLLGELQCLDGRLTASLELSLLWYLWAEADANWILRNYPFQQRAEGSGYSIHAKIEGRPHPRVTAAIGLRWVSLSAEDGTESGTVNGTSYSNEPIVPKIWSDVATVEISAGIDF